MEFWVTIFGLARRKWVIIPAVLIATGCGALAFSLTPIRYDASATMVVTTPTFGGTESQDPSLPTDLTNPMLNFNESLTTTSAILIGAMNTKAVSEQLGADAEGPTKLVIDDGRTNPWLLGLNGPFVYIVGQSTSREDATRVVRDAQALMRKTLRGRQSALGAPPKTFVTLVDVVPVSAPVASHWQRTKLGLVAFALGFGLTIAAAYARHRTKARRRERQPNESIEMIDPVERITAAELPPEGPPARDADRAGHLNGQPGRDAQPTRSPSPGSTPVLRANVVEPRVLSGTSKKKVWSGER